MEVLTNGRDEALKRILEGLATLIASPESIKHEEETFQRYSKNMIHIRDLLLKLQSQPSLILTPLFLQRIESEVDKSLKIIDTHKSEIRLLRPFSYRSVLSKLNQSAKNINEALQILQCAQINTLLNINVTADDLIHRIESLQLVMVSGKCAAASSSVVCPLPLPSNCFFVCPLTAKVLEDPVSLACGHSFERKAIEECFRAGQNLCPFCWMEISSSGKLELTTNFALRDTILQWKEREERASVERNARKRFMDAAAEITLDNMENTNRALSELRDLMKEIPSCIGVETESSCKLVPKLADLLRNSSENTSTVLECLLLIARFSDENRERIGRRGVINCLLKESVTEPTAVEVLLELSRNKAVAEKIGGITHSISSLISLISLDDPSSAVGEMARAVLENLSIVDINSTVTMAKFGYFTPFLEQFNSHEISDEIRADMAKELSQIQLTETSARNLENERFIALLTQMLYCNLPSSKMSSLNCIKKFMAFNELRTCFLQNESAILALLSLITSKAVEEKLKQNALEILISLIQTTPPSNPGFKTLFSSNNVQDMIEQIKTSAPEDQAALLRLLLVMVQNSYAAGEWIVSDHNAMSSLLSAINVEQNSKVKANALKLIYCIAVKHHIVIHLPSSSSKESIVASLITILTESRIDEELSAAAAGILIHLPDDRIINELLQRAVLKSIHALITHLSNSHLLLENALGLLLRCINQSQSSSEFQKKVCKLVRTDLIQILSTGSPLAKQRAALILSHLSRSTAESSFASRSRSTPSLHSVRHRLVYLTRSVREGDGSCPVHKSSCVLQGVICLVVDKAVKPLIEMVKVMEFSSSEAALMALNTLFDTGCDFNGAAAAIVESDGATPILEVLERGEMSVKEKALELFCKIYKHPGITEKELERFKGLLLNIVRKEDGLKNKAEKLLKDLVFRLDHYGFPV